VPAQSKAIEALRVQSPASEAEAVKDISVATPVLLLYEAEAEPLQATSAAAAPAKAKAETEARRMLFMFIPS